MKNEKCEILVSKREISECWVHGLQPDEIILKLDIRNAHNTISRDACLAGVKLP